MPAAVRRRLTQSAPAGTLAAGQLTGSEAGAGLYTAWPSVDGLYQQPRHFKRRLQISAGTYYRRYLAAAGLGRATDEQLKTTLRAYSAG